MKKQSFITIIQETPILSDKDKQYFIDNAPFYSKEIQKKILAHVQRLEQEFLNECHSKLICIADSRGKKIKEQVLEIKKQERREKESEIDVESILNQMDHGK